MKFKKDRDIPQPIFYKDVNVRVHAENLANIINISTTRQGIEISMSSRKEFKDILFFVLGLLGVGIGGVCLTSPIPILLFLGICLVCFSLSVILQEWKEIISGKETLLISMDEIRIVDQVFLLGIQTERRYDIRKIANLRESRLRLQFDYGAQTIKFGEYIDSVGARRLIKHYMSDILAFHCHSVERIFFGTTRLTDDDPVTTLRNPDVSTLTFPFVRLKQIMIDTTTYDVYQVERFLTYAVNYIGQTYLKEHVDVHVYGALEKLQSNLRNSLTNLCKQMTVHEEEDLFLTMSP